VNDPTEVKLLRVLVAYGALNWPAVIRVQHGLRHQSPVSKRLAQQHADEHPLMKVFVETLRDEFGINIGLSEPSTPKTGS